MSALRESDAAVFSQRIEKLGYLMNVVLAGSSDRQGRALRPVDALQTVLRACDAGLRAHFDAKVIASGAALSLVARPPADRAASHRNSVRAHGVILPAPNTQNCERNFQIASPENGGGM